MRYYNHEVRRMRRRAQSFDPRQVMKRGDYEIFHFRDPKMQEVPLHHHDFYEIYFFLSGRVDYLVEGINYTLNPGDLMLISPMELHRPTVAPEEAYERVVLWINAEYLRKKTEGTDFLERCFQPGHNLFHVSRTPIPELIRRLAEEFGGQAGGASLYAEGLLLQLLAELLRLAAGSGDAAEARQSSPLIESVLHYIGEHYREEISLDELAERFYVSKYHLSHLFRQTVGVSVYRYILLKRLQHARQLLSEGESPGSAGRASGFPEYSGFYRAFRQVYGTSPGEAAGQ